MTNFDQCTDLAKSLMPGSKIKFYGPKRGGPNAGWVTQLGNTVCSKSGDDKESAMSNLLKEMQAYSSIINSGKIAKFW